MSQQQYQLAVVGAGIAGLSTALALLKAGYGVTVFEKAAVIEEVGAGLQLSANATAILHEWGVLEEIQRVAFKPQGIRMSHWKTGQTIANFTQNSPSDIGISPYLHVHRADLHAVLLAAVRALDPNCVVVGAEVISVENISENARIELADGSAHTFDWVVGADGIHSVVRPTALSIESSSNFTGNIAWRGLIPRSSLGSAPDPLTHVIMGPGGHIVFYYVRGGELLNYVAVIERSDWALESWTERGSIPEMLQDFAGWDPALLNTLSLTDPACCFRWALHDRDPLPTWSVGRCLLLGDAAHPMLPFLAQGAAMGIEDAQALVQCLSLYPAETVGEHLFALRGARTAKVQLTARKNSQIFHIRNPLIRFCRDVFLGIAGAMCPGFMNKKLQWLYGYRL